MNNFDKDNAPENCPKCGSPLTDVIITASGKRLRRCSTGTWNPQTKQTDGCNFVKWLEVPPQELDEKCPKCGASLILVVTRFGKKMKKCSTSGWDKEKREAIGCDYVEWINGTKEPLDEKCPLCNESLVLYTSASGKKMKKCSTSGWDKVKRQPTGCSYIYWLKPGEDMGGDQQPPPEE